MKDHLEQNMSSGDEDPFKFILSIQKNAEDFWIAVIKVFVFILRKYFEQLSEELKNEVKDILTKFDKIDEIIKISPKDNYVEEDLEKNLRELKKLFIEQASPLFSKFFSKFEKHLDISKEYFEETLSNHFLANNMLPDVFLLKIALEKIFEKRVNNINDQKFITSLKEKFTPVLIEITKRTTKEKLPEEENIFAIEINKENFEASSISKLIKILGKYSTTLGLYISTITSLIKESLKDGDLINQEQLFAKNIQLSEQELLTYLNLVTDKLIQSIGIFLRPLTNLEEEKIRNPIKEILKLRLYFLNSCMIAHKLAEEFQKKNIKNIFEIFHNFNDYIENLEIKDINHILSLIVNFPFSSLANYIEQYAKIEMVGIKGDLLSFLASFIKVFACLYSSTAVKKLPLSLTKLSNQSDQHACEKEFLKEFNEILFKILLKVKNIYLAEKSAQEEIKNIAIDLSEIILNQEGIFTYFLDKLDQLDFIAESCILFSLLSKIVTTKYKHTENDIKKFSNRQKEIYLNKVYINIQELLQSDFANLYKNAGHLRIESLEIYFEQLKKTTHAAARCLLIFPKDEVVRSELLNEKQKLLSDLDSCHMKLLKFLASQLEEKFKLVKHSLKYQNSEVHLILDEKNNLKKIINIYLGILKLDQLDSTDKKLKEISKYQVMVENGNLLLDIKNSLVDILSTQKLQTENQIIKTEGLAKIKEEFKELQNISIKDKPLTNLKEKKRKLSELLSKLKSLENLDFSADLSLVQEIEQLLNEIQKKYQQTSDKIKEEEEQINKEAQRKREQMNKEAQIDRKKSEIDLKLKEFQEKIDLLPTQLLNSSEDDKTEIYWQVKKLLEEINNQKKKFLTNEKIFDSQKNDVQEKFEKLIEESQKLLEDIYNKLMEYQQQRIKKFLETSSEEHLFKIKELSLLENKLKDLFSLAQTIKARTNFFEKTAITNSKEIDESVLLNSDEQTTLCNQLLQVLESYKILKSIDKTNNDPLKDLELAIPSYLSLLYFATNDLAQKQIALRQAFKQLLTEYQKRFERIGERISNLVPSLNLKTCFENVKIFVLLAELEKITPNLALQLSEIQETTLKFSEKIDRLNGLIKPFITKLVLNKVLPDLLEKIRNKYQESLDKPTKANRNPDPKLKPIEEQRGIIETQFSPVEEQKLGEQKLEEQQPEDLLELAYKENLRQILELNLLPENLKGLLIQNQSYSDTLEQFHQPPLTIAKLKTFSLIQVLVKVKDFELLKLKDDSSLDSLFLEARTDFYTLIRSTCKATEKLCKILSRGFEENSLDLLESFKGIIKKHLQSLKESAENLKKDSAEYLPQSLEELCVKLKENLSLLQEINLFQTEIEQSKSPLKNLLIENLKKCPKELKSLFTSSSKLQEVQNSFLKHFQDTSLLTLLQCLQNTDPKSFDAWGEPFKKFKDALTVFAQLLIFPKQKELQAKLLGWIEQKPEEGKELQLSLSRLKITLEDYQNQSKYPDIESLVIQLKQCIRFAVGETFIPSKQSGNNSNKSQVVIQKPLKDQQFKSYPNPEQNYENKYRFSNKPQVINKKLYETPGSPNNQNPQGPKPSNPKP